MGNALFIVWRESVEAILIVGILYAWICERGGGRIGLRHLWSGVGAGVGLAVLLAIAILSIQTQLGGTALDVFQVVIVFAAAALITQMVLWMRRHGRQMKREFEEGLQRAAQGSGGSLPQLWRRLLLPARAPKRFCSFTASVWNGAAPNSLRCLRAQG